MNIEDQLLQEHSKENTQCIVQYIGTDQNRLKELMQCFFSDTYRVSQRAAMAVSHCFDEHPDMMQPYQIRMIELLETPKLQIALKRNIVRILQFMEFPEQYEAQLFDRCLGYLTDAKEAIAVKAFSMTILYNICKNHPDLKHELIPILQELLLQSESAGIQNRGRKVLQALYRL